MKKLIYIDFDGVLNQYKGWQDAYVLFKPRDGVKEFLNVLSQDYEIHIFTTRNPDCIKSWLTKYNLICYVDHITNIKAPAYAYIDDRAIRFKGNYLQTLTELKNFKPYWKEI